MSKTTTDCRITVRLKDIRKVAHLQNILKVCHCLPQPLKTYQIDIDCLLRQLPLPIRAIEMDESQQKSNSSHINGNV